MVSAFGNRTQRIKKEEMLEIKIQEDVSDHVFLISAQLVVPLILWVDYLLSGNVVMNFKEAYFTSERDGIIHKHQFICEEEIVADIPEDLISRSNISRCHIPNSKTKDTDTVISFQVLKGP